jgi:hypothetical protein
LQQQFGRIFCDRFATSTNKVINNFNSYFYEPQTAGVDAFAQGNWLEGLNWVHPPISIIDKTVKFLECEQPHAKCLVLVPKWIAQPWYKQLEKMSIFN